MGSILVVAEIQNGKIREASYELTALARQVAGSRPLHSVVIGKGVADQAEALAKRGGGEVHLVEGDAFANYTPDAHAKAIESAVVASDAELVLVSNTPTGWDVAPRVAASLDAGFVSDCFSIQAEGGALVYVRRIFNGKLDARLRPKAPRVVATIQTGATSPFEGAADGKVSPLSVSLSPQDTRTRFVETRVAEAKGVDLSKAEVIVSGGRGVGAPEKFGEVIKPLAEALGGAMGASRPVVDAGWLPHEYQVGSSGQIVSPKLYIACGISGAIQHLVGMKGSNFIIAINKDGDAPIFEVANLGVVGDLFELVPALTKAVKEAKGA
jgi:electron transfer flavoprotein alpha subunit